MAFFDRLGKKASETTARAMQKAQELSEVSRLNTLISDEERKINSAYYQIGKLFVSLHGADADENFADFVGVVRESEGKINQYREQIQMIKGVQHCENCGAEISREAAFCSNCGAPRPKDSECMVPAADVVKCENCNAWVKKGMRFCTSCGQQMQLAETNIETQQSVVEEINSADNSETAEVCRNEEITSVTKNVQRFCSNCGAAIPEDVIFCPECGTKQDTTDNTD